MTRLEDDYKVTIEDLKRERKLHVDAIETIDMRIAAKEGRTLVQCTSNVMGKGCGMASEIRELDYIQTQWYTPPHGCTGGDYWNNGEGQFKCPHCGHTNRLYDRPEIEKLKARFKSIETRKDRG